MVRLAMRAREAMETCLGKIAAFPLHQLKCAESVEFFLGSQSEIAPVAVDRRIARSGGDRYTREVLASVLGKA